MHRVVVLAALAFALAGCAGTVPDLADAEGDGGVEALRAPPEPRIESFTFTRGLGVGLPIAGGLPGDDGAAVPFEVPAGYTRMEVAVEWVCKVQTGVDPLCDLEVELRHGDQEVMTGAYGASPLGLDVDRPAAGRWTYWAFPAESGTLQTGVEGTVTVLLS